MSVNDFLKSLQFRSSNATKRRKQRTAQLASRQVVAAEAVESRMLLTPVLALNPVSGLEGDTTHFDGQFSGVTPGNQYTIDVNWGDGSAIQQISGVAVGGGLDKFSVSHNYGDNGAYSISAKLTESPLIIGADAIYVIDVSGSTQTLLAGPSIGDVNMDGRSNSVLDLEIAGFLALNNDLVARGLGNISKVSLVSFDATARTVDLNPAMAGVQAWTTPLADNDHNGVRDVDQALRTLRSLGGTNFEAALQTTISVALQVGTPPGQGNVVLLSDGMSQSVAFGDEAGVLRGPLGMNVRAFGVGASANLNQLQQIDPLATTFVNTNQLLSTFSGSGTVGGGIATASVMGHIFNVAPTVSGLVIDPIIDESGTATLAGSFIDPGAFDSHTIEIAWGDGAVESITLAAGQRTFAVPHQYINQVTTPIYVTLRDVDGGSSSSQTQIQVMNVSPEILTATVNSAADNGGIATLFVEFSDPGTVDLHTVQVQWGDGTSDVLTLPAGERTVSLAHDYIGATLASSIANIRVSVADETLAESVQFLQTLVNVAPTVSIVSLTPTIDENGFAALDGLLVDPGEPNTEQVTIDWGDGTSETLAIVPGSFNVVHQYLNDGATPAAQETYFVSVNAVDGFGLTDSANEAITVNNVAPTIAALNVTQTVDENGVATLAVSFTDVGTLDTHTASIAWGDGSVETIALAAGERAFSLTHQYLDDTPSGTTSDSYVISVSVSDDDTGTVASSVTTTVQNVAPTLLSLVSSATMQSIGQAGQAISISGQFSDVGRFDTYQVTANWGDGSPAEVTPVLSANGVGVLQLTHIYQTGGIFKIGVTLADDDGGTVSETTSAIVSGVRLVDGVLQVIGTNQNDRIELDVEGEDDSHRDHQTDHNHNSGRSIEVKAGFLTPNGNMGDDHDNEDHRDDDHDDVHGGRRQFDLADVQSILIIGADGNDRIDVSEDVRLNTLIDGGTGNDDIHGGGGSDVLLGGLGHDQLSGRDGRDILIGGDGRDELDGGDHDDILIGNQTAYDSTDLPQTAAWNAIQAEWTSGRSRNVRMQNLMDGSGSAARLNDGFFIRLGSDPTIFDDGDRDLIDGERKEDWMFLMGTDRRDS